MNNCICCNNKLSKRQPKYCSRSCAAKINNLGVVRNGTTAPLCIVCNNKTKESDRKYCTLKCFHQGQYDDFIRKWISGVIPIEDTFSGVNNQISSHIRRYLLVKYNNSCSECGWNKIHPVTGRVPLQINHIDGNSRNNLETNLNVLCPNCHSLTDNFGSLNRGKSTRTQRRNAGIV